MSETREEKAKREKRDFWVGWFVNLLLLLFAVGVGYGAFRLMQKAETKFPLPTTPTAIISKPVPSSPPQ